MGRLRHWGLALAVIVVGGPAGAQVKSTFNSYTSPTTTEYQAAIGAPVTSGVLDFYATEFFVAGARNVLGTWGTADVGAVNRPTNIGTSTAMFGTQLGEEVDIFGKGTDVVGAFNGIAPFLNFSLFSIDVAHLYSTAFSPFALNPFTFTVFAFGPSTGGATISQAFTIPAPASIGGVQSPFLTTVTLDSRFSNVSNAWFNQSNGSGSAYQFTNVVASTVPEPSTYVMLLTGLVSLGLFYRWRRSQTAG